MQLFQGKMALRTVPIPIGRAALRRMLPATLYLPEHVEPVVLFVFGQQKDVKPRFWLLPGVDYSEAVFAVPNLRLRAYPTQGPCVYWPKLFVSHLLPLLVGEFYGFRKQLSRWTHTHRGDHAGSLVVTDLATRSPLVELEYEDVGGSEPVADYPVLNRDGFLHQPVVSFNHGAALSTAFSYQPGATVQGCRVRARFALPDLPELPRDIEVDPLTETDLGGFRSKQLYRFGLPKVERLPDVPDPMPPAKPRKVAILGGGVGAITAAFALTEQPDWQQRWDITVYQMGWRLGGKGASGRNVDHGQRIEEHGLHLWAGFYDQAFRAFRDCYQGLQDAGLMDGVFSDWRHAFSPVDKMTMEEHLADGWHHLDVAFPENDEVPGDHRGVLTPEDYLHMLLTFLREHLRRPQQPLPAAIVDALADLGDLEAQVASQLRDMEHLVAVEAPRVSAIGGAVLHDLEEGALHAAHLVFSHARDDNAGDHRAAAHGLVAQLLAHAQQQLHDHAPAHAADNPLVHAWFCMLDLTLAIGRGMLAEDVLEHGFGVLDQYDLKAFLGSNGASATALDSSTVRGGYDYVFGFADGDLEQPALAAGVACLGALKVFFEYKQAILFRMNAGMGDTIFTPYYKLLRHRGVKFAFFNRVLEVQPDDAGGIGQIRVQEQARVRGGGAYDPLVRVGDLQCWPDRPQYGQLEEGAELQSGKINLESFWSPWNARVGSDPACVKVLERGRDFDDVVLGLSLGSLPHVCPALGAAHPPWQAMVDHGGTVQTMAMQLWTRGSPADLGWGPQHGMVATSYIERMSTYADMSHLKPVEAWPAPGPEGIAYFCGVLQDATDIPPPTEHSFPASQWQRVRDTGVGWLDGCIGQLWPNAVSDGHFDLGCLWTAPEHSGDPMAGQFFRANIDPSERYVQSQPGSIQYRLAAGESGFDNLYLAGDWVRTSISAGCVEAATEAGMDAAKAMLEGAEARLDAARP